MIPNWIPSAQWSAWKEMRRRKKVPNTERAMKLAVTKLTSLRAQGQNIAEVIDQSTLRGWTSFYAIKPSEAVVNPFEGAI